METIDPAKAARVWQRVTGDAPPENREKGLLALIRWTVGKSKKYRKAIDHDSLEKAI